MTRQIWSAARAAMSSAAHHSAKSCACERWGGEVIAEHDGSYASPPLPHRDELVGGRDKERRLLALLKGRRDGPAGARACDLRRTRRVSEGRRRLRDLAACKEAPGRQLCI